MPLWAFLTGYCLALALTPLIRLLARRTGVLDAPDQARKFHGKPIPLLGGLAIFVAVAVGAVALRGSLLGGFLLGKHLAGIVIGALVLVIGGALDDRYDLPPWAQICFTVTAALAIVASGIGVDVITNPFGGVLHTDLWHLTVFTWHDAPYRLSLPGDIITFGWLLMMMYATKLLDGLDGLVSGLTVIGAVVVALLALTPEMGQPELASFALIVAGAFAGFLFYNSRPASIFLGEGGSTLAGFLLGTLAILSGAKIGITMLVMAIPLLDLLWTIFRRFVLARRSIAAPDAQHLHFLLVASGVSPGVTVALFWLFAAAFGGAGLFIPGRAKVLAFILLVALFVAVTVAVRQWARRNRA